MNITTEDAALVSRDIESANFTVARLKRNVLKSSNIGVLFVNSEDGISDFNRAIGVDGGFVLGQARDHDDGPRENVFARRHRKGCGRRRRFRVEERSIHLRRQYLDVG
jgi:hypothetical protein